MEGRGAKGDGGGLRTNEPGSLEARVTDRTREAVR